ncbi:MAG: class I SAM-dependent methyltransferase [Woeseia sp.]
MTKRRSNSRYNPSDKAFLVGMIVVFFGFGVILMSFFPEQDQDISMTALLIGVTFVVIGLGVGIPDARIFLLQVFTTFAQALPWRRQATSAPTEPAAEEQQVYNLPGTSEKPVRVQKRWAMGRSARSPVLELIGPSYILDSTYHFMDWNPLFEKIVATPLKLVRGDHAESFIARLKNVDDVVERSRTRFAPGNVPLVDTELLVFSSEVYGDIRFRKIAAQIADEQGRTKTWSINLNILDADKIDDLWSDVESTLNESANWSRYAVSYDKLLLNFDDYKGLIRMVTDCVGDAEICADLGAGTGNGTIRLLENSSERKVWAVEQNEMMLEKLRTKVMEYDQSKNTNFKKRLRTIKENIIRLSGLPSDYFDAAILINVLYSIDNREDCLRQVHRILKSGGILALSTAHSETDVDKLFDAIRQQLTNKDLYEELKENFEDSYRRHQHMSELIHRDTKDDIRGYLKSTGFEIRDWHDSAYVGAVVVVKAVKV